MRKKRETNPDPSNRRDVWSRLAALQDPDKEQELRVDIARDWNTVLEAGVPPMLVERFADNLMLFWVHAAMLLGFDLGWRISRHLLASDEERELMRVAGNPKLTKRMLCVRLDRTKIPLPSYYADELQARGQTPSWEMAYLMTPKMHRFEEHLRQICLRAREINGAKAFRSCYVLPHKKRMRSRRQSSEPVAC
jgi:hypothetical protein